MIIGFGHQARTGKGWAARILEQHCAAIQVNFADELYSDMARLFRWPNKLRTDAERVEFKHARLEGHDGRYWLQRYGAAKRKHNPNYWVDAAARKIDKLQSDPATADRPIVITDVRYPNELEWLRQVGGVYVKVERPSLPPVRSDAHISETALNRAIFDFLLVNLDNALAFEANVLCLFDQIKWELAS